MNMNIYGAGQVHVGGSKLLSVHLVLQSISSQINLKMEFFVRFSNFRFSLFCLLRNRRWCSQKEVLKGVLQLREREEEQWLVLFRLIYRKQTRKKEWKYKRINWKKSLETVMGRPKYCFKTFSNLNCIGHESSTAFIAMQVARFSYCCSCRYLF